MIDTLVLGCGPRPQRRQYTHKETFLDCRSFKGAVDVVHDLNFTPWPFSDNSFDEVVAIHLVEHLKDLLQFMDECWRVLRPGGALYIVTPEAGADFGLTHADPTHVRCYRLHSWINYFTRSEAPKFGYTDKYWAIWDGQVREGCIHLHMMPLKKEQLEQQALDFMDAMKELESAAAELRAAPVDPAEPPVFGHEC